MSLRDQGRTDDVAGWMRLNESLVKERDALAAELAACKEWSAARIGCDGRIRELEEQRDAWKRLASDELPGDRTVSETPDAMRARIVTETADAIAAQAETELSGMEIAQREADEAAGDNDPRDRVWGGEKSFSAWATDPRTVALMKRCENAEASTKETKVYPEGFGMPVLVDRIDANLDKGMSFEEALQETAEYAELRSEVIFKLREYYQSDRAGKP